MTQQLNMTPAALGAFAKGDMDNFLVAATPGGIERQEAQGQRDLVSSFNRLPKELDAPGSDKYRDSDHGWAVAERLGFQKTAENGDDIFQGVIAPAGWSLRPTEHSMHSEIIDDKGRKRGSVFYKAAFYDRNAHGSFEARFQHKSVFPETYDGSYTLQALDTATGDVLGSVDIPARSDAADAWEVRDAIEKEARETVSQMIVDAGYPDWKSAENYWN